MVNLELGIVLLVDVPLSSGGVVEIKDGFAVHSGAQLRVSSGPTTGPVFALSVSQGVAVPQTVRVVGIE